MRNTEKSEKENRGRGVGFSLTRREYDHVIAALRVYQTMLEMHSAVCQDVEDIATEHGEEMLPEEIDAFIEKLQFGEVLPC